MPASKGKQLEPVVCPLCESFSSKRVTAFEKHLNEEHKTTAEELYVKLYGRKLCKCGCGQKTTWVGWKHGFNEMLRGHNASIYNVYDEESAKEIAKTRGTNWRGKESPWKGKTKETDEGVAARAAATSNGRKEALASGKIAIWSKGKTKETDERIKSLSESIKNDYASGKRVTWHKHKTEQSDSRLKEKNDFLRERYENGELTTWSKGKTAETDPRIAKTWQNRDVFTEYAHIRWSDEEISKKLESNIRLSLEKIEKYKNIYSTSLFVRCRFCNWEGKVSFSYAETDRCPKCQPKGSKGQNQLANWLETLGFTIGQNVRGVIGREELDILILSKSFAIEYNGLYYHNEASGKGMDYHSDKTHKCQKNGITLFHVFEDEWNEKPDIVKSMLKHRLGLTDERVFARKCKIVELTPNQRRDFFDSTHIDGDTNAKIAWGLFHNETLVAALSLRKPFHKKHNNFLELARFSTQLNTSVVGGLARLSQVALRYALENGFRNGLITYVDTRHGHGRGYEAAGFTRVGRTPNRFWWTNNNVRFNRFKFRADSKAGFTESQVAAEHGVVKIWGCPNLIFELKP